MWSGENNSHIANYKNAYYLPSLPLKNSTLLVQNASMKSENLNFCGEKYPNESISSNTNSSRAFYPVASSQSLVTFKSGKYMTDLKYITPYLHT